MIDLNKPLQTLGGAEVRIYATDGNPKHPIHGAYVYEGKWWPCAWTTEGKHWHLHDGPYHADLVNKPEEHTVWFNFYPDTVGYSYPYRTREAADRAASADRTACVPVTYKDGDGL